MTNYDIEIEFSSYVSSNEKFIWTGRPKTGSIQVMPILEENQIGTIID